MESGQERSLLYPHDVTGEIITRLKSSHHMHPASLRVHLEGQGGQATQRNTTHSLTVSSNVECTLGTVPVASVWKDHPVCMYTENQGLSK